MRRCGCESPLIGPIEFEIENNIEIPNYEFDGNIGSYGIQDLKEIVVDEFLNILNKLQCGIQSPLETILEHIALIEIYNE